MFRPSDAERAACSIGTSLDRLVPCMSGSSKRTLRMPCSFHPVSTCSTEADFFSAIAMASTPASVVPDADLEPELACDRLDCICVLRRQDGKNAALAAVTAEQRRRDHAWRLQVMAVPTQGRVRIADGDQCVLRSADEHRQLDEMADVPIWRWTLDLLARELTQQHVRIGAAAPKAPGADVGDEARAQIRSAFDQALHPIGRPPSPDRRASQRAIGEGLDGLHETGGRGGPLCPRRAWGLGGGGGDGGRARGGG